MTPVPDAGVPEVRAGNDAGLDAEASRSAPGLSSSFFGMSAGAPSDPSQYPSVSVGAVGHPGVLAWLATEGAGRGTYDFTQYDAQIEKAASHGVPMYVTFGYTPAWAVSDKSSCNAMFCTVGPDDLSDWTDFVQAIATRYKGKVAFWEIWNEANGPSFWTGTVGELVALAAAAYPILKATDPSALVFAPSTSGPLAHATPWLSSYLTAGGAKYADGCAAHGYPAQEAPVPFPEETSVNGSIVERLTAFRMTCDTGGLAGKPMVMSEGSWGQNQFLTDPTEQADWAARYLLLQAGASEGLSLIGSYWYAWGSGGGAQYGSIANPDNSPTPAGQALGEVHQWITGSVVSTCAQASVGTVWSCAMTRAADPAWRGLAVWSTSGTPVYPVAAPFKTSRALDGSVVPVSESIVLGQAPVLLEGSVS